jgi:hypothetical protein
MLSPVIMLRIWQSIAGLLTAFLIVRFFTPEQQGWYYSFISVVAIYTLFDLGLSAVLVQVSVHESVGLKWHENFSFSGERKNVFNALLYSARYRYTILALSFTLLVLPSGYIFFSYRGGEVSYWHWPWLLLCLMTAANLVVIPFMSVLEGAGQIDTVYRVRLLQAVLGSIACWIMLASGAGLWASAMVPLLAVLVTTGWLWFCARSFLISGWTTRGSAYDWRNEVWPLQWRLAVSWMSGYLVTQINIPILFLTDGAILAGQFGLSLAVVNTIGLICQSCFTRHVPEMTQAVMARDWGKLDKLFFQNLVKSLLLFIVSTFVLLTGCIIFDQSSLVNRLLPFWPLVGLLVYSFVSLIVSAWALHLRSFRREPLLLIMFICNLLILPGVLVATNYYSINGMILVLDIVYLFILLPKSWSIWRRCKRDWKGNL